MEPDVMLRSTSNITVASTEATKKAIRSTSSRSVRRITGVSRLGNRPFKKLAEHVRKLSQSTSDSSAYDMGIDLFKVPDGNIFKCNGTNTSKSVIIKRKTVLDTNFKYVQHIRNKCLELDDGEDFIYDIIDELMSTVQCKIYDKYIEKQLLPYTISQVKDALLTIVDWQFLACDVGEHDPSTDETWQEDEEPASAIADCWAQGSVPRTIATTIRPDSAGSQRHESVSVVGEVIPEEDIEDLEPKLDEQPKPWEVRIEDILDKPENESELLKSETPSVTDRLPTPPKIEKSKRIKFRPHKGRLASAGLSNLAESLEATEIRLRTEERLRQQAATTTVDDYKHTADQLSAMPKSVGSILKFQSGRPPGNRDVYYDQDGNIVAMSKINPDKLPTHRIRTKFHVIDPSVEAAQSRLDAMRTGRYLASKAPIKKQQKKTYSVPGGAAGNLDKTSILDYRSVNSHTTKTKTAAESSPVTPLPPPMIETMELAAGVIVREGDRVKRGPRMTQRHGDRLPAGELLRPVGDSRGVRIMVQELLGAATPKVRIEPTPVPPIPGSKSNCSPSIHAR